MKHYDANTMLAFINNQRNHIETTVNKTIFPEVQYAQLIPVDTSAPEWTKTVTYYNQESYGQADWVNGNADDIPLAGNTYGKSEEKIHMAGIGYGYGYEELQASLANGVNLPNEDAVAARQTYERFVDKVAFLGDETKGMQGLINNTNVATNAAAGAFSTLDEAGILKEVNGLLKGANGQPPKSTLLLPVDVMTYLASAVLSNKQGTLLQFIKEHNVYTATTGQPLTVRAFHRLEGAGDGDTNRAVAYDRSPQVVKLHIPMPHRFLPTFQTGALNFVVPGIFRLGGTEIRNKDGIAYLDGV